MLDRGRRRKKPHSLLLSSSSFRPNRKTKSTFSSPSTFFLLFQPTYSSAMTTRARAAVLPLLAGVSLLFATMNTQVRIFSLAQQHLFSSSFSDIVSVRSRQRFRLFLRLSPAQRRASSISRSCLPRREVVGSERLAKFWKKIRPASCPETPRKKKRRRNHFFAAMVDFDFRVSLFFVAAPASTVCRVHRSRLLKWATQDFAA